MTPHQRQIVQSKPLASVRRFAAMLNWRGLQMDWIRFSEHEIEAGVAPPPGILVTYMTTDLRFNLQINEFPFEDSNTLQATIKADRYGIRDIGWHPFTLFEDEEALIAEAERLRPWLDRKRYRTPSRLRKLKAEKQCVLVPTRKKPRGCTA